MTQLRSAVEAAGFANVCAFECSDELHREAVDKWRAGRRWQNMWLTGGATFATLALAALLVVI